MGKLTLKINDKIESELRIYIIKNIGLKGELGKTIEGIISNFLKNPSKIPEFVQSNYVFTPKKELADKFKDFVLNPDEIKDANERFDAYYNQIMEQYKASRVSFSMTPDIPELHDAERIPIESYEDTEEYEEQWK